MISLATTVYDKNLDFVLSNDSWFLNYENELIKEKILVVNNISNKDVFLEKIQKNEKAKLLNVVFVDLFKEEAKKFFNININESTLGYFYTIQYFVLLLKCNNPFLFNVSTDCTLNFEKDFLYDSIDELKKNERAIATTIPWCTNVNCGLGEEERTFKMIEEEEKHLDKFYYSVFFSDQVFLSDVEKMKKINFNTNHPLSNFFPIYGGNCFEKRVCSHFLTEKNFRLVYKKHNYIHPNNLY